VTEKSNNYIKEEAGKIWNRWDEDKEELEKLARLDSIEDVPRFDCVDGIMRLKLNGEWSKVSNYSKLIDNLIGEYNKEVMKIDEEDKKRVPDPGHLNLVKVVLFAKIEVLEKLKLNDKEK